MTKPWMLNCSLSHLGLQFETPSFFRTPWKTLTHGVTTQTSWWTWWWRPPTSSTRRRWWALDGELVEIRTWPCPGSQNPGSRSCGSNWVILPGGSELFSIVCEHLETMLFSWSGNSLSDFSVSEPREWKDEYLWLKWVRIHTRKRTLLLCSFIDGKSIAVINSVLTHDRCVFLEFQRPSDEV